MVRVNRNGDFQPNVQSSQLSMRPQMGWSTVVLQCCPKKLLRPLIAGFLITAVLIVLFLHRDQDIRIHHAPYQAPSTSIVVHGNKVFADTKPMYPLEPFPDSPMEEPLKVYDGTPRPWLAAVISTAEDADRRMMIRSTWMRLFRDLPFDGRFVVSNPGPQWTQAVALENRTFGDMIVLDHIQEDDITANTIKTLEFYKWLIASNKKYECVTKLDTDLWLNARGFWDRFLVHRLSNQTGFFTATVNRTVIGELYYSRNNDLVFPHGAMYTVTWDMIELLASLQNQFNIVTGEDMAVAVLMLHGKEIANFVNFNGSEKFDYDDSDTRGDGTAWAREASHTNAPRHALNENAIAVHQLKDANLWYKVAESFDEAGIKDKPSFSQKNRAMTPLNLLWTDFRQWAGLGDSPYKSRFDRIPEFLWEQGENGNWVCDGIWDLGRQKQRGTTEIGI